MLITFLTFGSKNDYLNQRQIKFSVVNMKNEYQFILNFFRKNFVKIFSLLIIRDKFLALYEFVYINDVSS